MIAYQYSKDKGEYVGEIERQSSPLEAGVFLLPGHSTEIPPPKTAKYEIAIWNGKSWEIKADYRNVPYWHKVTKEQFIIQEIDCYPDPDWTDQDPAKVDLQYTKWDEAKGRWVYDADAKAVADQAAINAEARAYLARTDWYQIRYQETGKAIPDGILAERQAARERVVEA